MTDQTTGASERHEDLGSVGSPVQRPVGRLEPERAGLLAQIEACRREVAQWPDWMRQERTVPAWMTNHATDL